MYLFYAPDLDIQKEYQLSPDESHHAIRVLRLNSGSEIILVNGRGGWFEAQIIQSEARNCIVRILNKKEGVGKPSYDLHIALAPTKQIDRFEWFLEKCAEIGISRVTPLICDRSERREVKTDRLSRILISAMKQSLSAYHPIIEETTSFRNFIKNEQAGIKAIAHCATGEKRWLDEIGTKGSQFTILIGPEGDFTHPEIDSAVDREYHPITLGDSRLRTETAGIVACHTISWINRQA